MIKIRCFPKTAEGSIRKTLVLIGATMAFIGIGVFLMFSNSGSGRLPKEVIDSFSTSVYFPNPMPAGYSLEENSVRLEKNVLFYELRSGERAITVSQQPKSTGIDLEDVLGFEKLPLATGQAIIGNNEGSPVVLVSTNETFISISGSSKVSTSEITEAAQSLKTL